jgi:hypothetical protein
MTAISIQELLILFVIIAGNVFWIYALTKIASAEKGVAQKIWIIFVVLTNAIGASLYFITTYIKHLRGGVDEKADNHSA